ncbi:MAG: hypothetical protein R3350_03345, partial [Saprospiraceae bacterium]|nr:hypothetical protein [Saprospiraceae bacterium]
MRKILVLLGLGLLYACGAYRGLPEPVVEQNWKTKTIPASAQQEGGDPEAGYRYLLYGDFLGTGLPVELLKKRMGKTQDTILEREGVNATMPYIVNAFEAENGVMVGNGNCFTCHAGRLNGEVVIGLGNSFSDYTKGLVLPSKLMNFGMKLKYGKKSEEWDAFEDFGRYFKAMAPYIKTEQAGPNPAAMLAEA